MPDPARTWTDEQRAAITHAGGGLLVSAAAGSGKTSVLAERCVHAVCDATEPCDVHQLLVVTFTEAAAAEMKSRIGRALDDRHAATPTDRTARLVATLDRASISTLHAFCARLIRQHFHLLGIDPNFRTLDADEATLLRREVAVALFADLYDADDDAGQAFRGLIDRYGDGNDERLIDEVIRAHQTLCSVVDPAGWRMAAEARLAEAAEHDLGDTELGRTYLAGLARELRGVLADTEAAGRFVKSLGGFDGYVSHLREMFAIVKHLVRVLDDHGLDALAEEAAGVAVPKMKPVSNAVPNKELAKGRVDTVNTAIKDGPWRRLLAFTAAQWQAGMRDTLPDARTLLSLVDAFGAAYQAAKDAAGGLDFNDLERLALAVLSDGPDRPSAVARACHAQYRHVMVDEFQDINQVQDAILRRVSRECLGRPGASNLFCVGDVKQSIYRFRLADPQQFLARGQQYAADPSRGTLIHLRQNFRSRAPLLAALNAVFAKLMTAATADVDYDATQELVAGATFPPESTDGFAGAPLELHLLPTDVAAPDDDGGDAVELDRAQREAVLVGRRVLAIVGHATVAGRDGTVRPARFKDCVVLLRSMRFKADAFATQLRAMGVPVHADSTTGYFDATEVNDVLSLLHVLDNGQQDIPLAAVLRSPLANLPSPEDALARIRLAFPADARGKSVPFHQAVRSYADEQQDELSAKLTGLLDQLRAWRQAARDRPVADLLWAIYGETGYLAFCGGLPRGEQRQANLIELHDRARQFGQFRRQGLGRFLTFLEKLRHESDLGQASVASDADDVVRLMSIHRSKGQEFPIVFVPDLGKRINVGDLNGSILLDRTLGLGLRVVDEVRQVRYPSLAHTVVRQALRQQTLAEELRVLYVALTRAKEHLILIGTAKADAADQWRQRWADHPGPLPAETVLAAVTPLDWIGPTAANIGDRLVHVTVHAAEDVAIWAADQAAAAPPSPEQATRARLEPLDPAPPIPAEATAVIDRIGRPYPFADLTHMKAAAAVTSLAKHAPMPASTERVLDRPRFLSVSTGPATVAATDRGTATHAVLERLDFATAVTAADVVAQVVELERTRRISADEAKAVDVDSIVWLLSTETGRKLRVAGDGLRREVPVYFAHPPDGLPAAVDPMDQVMARGRLDVLVPDGAGWLIVDYKTDRVSGGAIDQRADEYAQQLALYRAAIERITDRPVTGTTLVFLDPRVERNV